MSDHQTPESLRRILLQCRTIAMVGLTHRTERPSHGVARYLQRVGYRIVPVNPLLVTAGIEVLGEKPYADLDDIPFPVDIVDCFRREEAIGPIADAAIRIGARCLWQQLDIANAEADARVRAAGLDSVMDRCIKIEHARHVGLPNLDGSEG